MLLTILKCHMGSDGDDLHHYRPHDGDGDPFPTNYR